MDNSTSNPFAPILVVPYPASDPERRFTLSLPDTDMVRVMDTFEEHGRYGNGYGWADVAVYILRTQLAGIEHSVELDPEGGCLFAHSADQAAIEELARALQNAFHNPSVLGELVANAPYEWE